MTQVTLSLVSHTNVGKTTLARTLLGHEIGEVRDAPHVTESATAHELLGSPAGDGLRLWDTPGFGDSARLVRRMRASGQPLGWLLSEVWDRWRDRAFWATQRALRHVQADSDVVLYLVNAAEPPAAAAYVQPEMELLAWLGKPVLVLLNQLGAPRAPALEAAEVEAWRAQLARWPGVKAVLPMDAFARCWVHELTLLQAVQGVLEGEKAAAMGRLAEAWRAAREATFDAAMQTLAESLARLALARVEVEGAAGLGARLRRVGAALAARAGAGPGADAEPLGQAQHRLVQALEAEVRASLARLISLHGLQGQAQGEILQRVAGQFEVHQRLPEGRAAVLGGALTGAVAGLKADLATGGLTMGGGLLAGGLLGALGAAGLARGINLVRGTGRSWVAWGDEALDAMVQAALLRYLAVAHFGRGRGQWDQGEAPPHWRQTVAQALAPQASSLQALWRSRPQRPDAPAPNLAPALQPLLAEAARQTLRCLYPQAPPSTPPSAPPPTSPPQQPAT
ncbi:MAG: DUF3482 domain-containing protein [Burkholderiales bacterium]|nr:DUF3482 domain-containing protein [Burkholderiales bacterium]